jgi:cupin 2 domain-containing protein
MSGNLFAGIPDEIPNEVFESLLENDGVRIERILSKGHTAPAEGWFDQDKDEWVLVLAGGARLHVESEASPRELGPGDYMLIPAHTQHKVTYTDPDVVTVWLAIFLPADA